MVEVEFDPTTRTTLRNGSTLGLHIVEKGFQTGGFLALTLFVPIAAIRGYRATGAWAVLGAKALETGARSAAITTLLTVIAGAARVATYEDLKVALEDRAYRLHYNKLQNRTDQFCRVGALVGGAAAAALQHGDPRLALGGAALGAGLGVAVHLATSAPFAKQE